VCLWQYRLINDPGHCVFESDAWDRDSLLTRHVKGKAKREAVFGNFFKTNL
jgi:hypothetical protein